MNKILKYVGIAALAGSILAFTPKSASGQKSFNYTEQYKEGFVDKNCNNIDDRIDKYWSQGGRCYRFAPGFVDENANGVDDRDEFGYRLPRGPDWPGDRGPMRQGFIDRNNNGTDDRAEWTHRGHGWHKGYNPYCPWY